MSDDPIMGNDEVEKAQEVAFNQVVNALKSPVSEEMFRILMGGLVHLAEHDTERVLDALRELPHVPSAKHLDHARDLAKATIALGRTIEDPTLSNETLNNFTDMASRAIVDLVLATQEHAEEKQSMRELLRLTQDSIVALSSRFSHISERMEDME